MRRIIFGIGLAYIGLVFALMNDSRKRDTFFQRIMET